MGSDTDEVEIKIEYVETFEKDPLRDNIKAKTSESQPIGLGEENELLSENIGSFGIQDQAAMWYKEIDESGRVKCQFCDLKYSTIQTLSHHIKTKHPTHATNLKRSILKNKRNHKLKCHICKTRFKFITELREHVKRQHILEDLHTSCKKCDATFNNREEMLNHLFQKHNITKKDCFSCNICGYRTYKKSHFNQHKNTHLSIKNNKCQYCDYCTNYLPNLRIHERIHTNDKPYSCDYEGCDYNCAAKSALRSHQLKHNREKYMLFCDRCSYQTVYRQSLKKHIDSHRRDCIRYKL